MTKKKALPPTPTGDCIAGDPTTQDVNGKTFMKKPEVAISQLIYGDGYIYMV